MKIIDRLKSYIEETGVSVQGCAESMGVSFPTLYRLLNGTSDKAALLKIDAFLDQRNYYPQEQDKPAAEGR